MINEQLDMSEAEKIYKTAFINAATANVIIDHDMTILITNDAFLDMVGYTKEEVEHKMKWTHFIAPDDKKNLERNHFKRRLEKRLSIPSEYECRIIDKAGETKYIYMKVGMIPNSKKSIASAIDITSSKNTEQKIIESEKKYRTLFELSNDAIFLLDGCVFIDCNNKAELLFGVSKNYITGKSLADFSPEFQIDGNTSHNKLNDIIILAYHDNFVKFEWWCLEASGTIILCEATITKTAISDKINFICTVKNITSSRKAEKEIAQLAEVVKQVAESVMITNIDGIIKYVNPSFEHLTGYKMTEVIGKTPSILKSGRHDKDFYERMWKKIHKSDVWRGLLINRTKSGNEIIMDAIISSIKNHDDSILGFVSVQRDVTQEYYLYEQLRMREEYFRAIFEKAPYSIVIRDFKSGKYTDVNQAFERLTGYSKDDIVNKSPKDIGLFTSNYDKKKYFDSLSTNRFVENQEISITTQSGKDVNAIISSVVIESDEHKSALSMMVDITEVKRLEEQLRQSQKMEVLGQLAGGVAHDFNNLLSSIQGNAELLRIYAAENSKLVKYIDSINKSCQLATSLIKKLLTFSRKEQTSFRPLDIHEAIIDTIAILERSFKNKYIIETILNASLSTVTGDCNLLQNVFINLAVNARDAMIDGGKVTFKTSNLIIDNNANTNINQNLTPGIYVLIEVSDTGSGIPTDILNKIYDPFFTTKPQDKGTGLGLSVVYGTLKDHNGSITVSSKVGEGSTFKIILPVSADKIESKNVAKTATIEKGWILVVDDEDCVRETTAELLSSIGYNILVARNGFEAIDVFKKEKDKVSLVILDVMMPEMNGEEVFKNLKVIDDNAKIIFVSGVPQQFDFENSSWSGTYNFLQKPFNISELNGLILNMTSKY